MPEERPTQDVWTWLAEAGLAALAFLIALAILGFFLGFLYDWYRALIERLYEFWQVIRDVIMVIAILVSIGLAGFIVVIFRRFWVLNLGRPITITKSGVEAPLAGALPAKPPIEKEVGDEWQEVEKLLQSEHLSDWNMAVLRADALLDEALQHLNYEGETLKERLDKVDPTKVPSLNPLYSAHRLRNMIAHDPTIAHTKETIVYALRSYRQGLKELGVLRGE